MAGRTTSRLGLAIAAALALTALAQAQPQQYQPGEVIYDFDNHENTCYPDNWTFFGYPQTDFGFTTQAEDGAGAFQTAGWEYCELNGFPQCQWTGSAVGSGLFTHPHCVPGGLDDANLDLSLGTGISVRIINDITTGFGGTLGARVQLVLEDPDGTVAVLPRVILANPAVNRCQPVVNEWRTYKFFFAGLDSAWDNASAVSGSIPGLDRAHIAKMRLMWRRYEANGTNGFRFDEITLIDDPALPWADANADGDVDMVDVADFQQHVGVTPEDPFKSQDADYDGDIDAADWQILSDCVLGPNVTTGFYAWAF